MTRFGNVLESEIPARTKKKCSDKMGMENEVVEKGWGASGSASALCDSAARLLPALQVEVREPPGCRRERPKACECWALSRRSLTLLSQIPNLAGRAGRSRGRKSLKCRVECAQVPGRAGAHGAPVIAILPGNENERAGSCFHSRPGGLGGGQGPASAGAEPQGAVAPPGDAGSAGILPPPVDRLSSSRALVPG